jgi:hypothetical protein
MQSSSDRINTFTLSRLRTMQSSSDRINTCILRYSPTVYERSKEEPNFSHTKNNG